MAHSFGKFCIEKLSLVEKENLQGFMKALLTQSNKEAALTPYHDMPYQLNIDDPEEKEEGSKIKAPRYYGAGGEFLAECFFEVFGHDYNLTSFKSYDDEEKVRRDGGVDHESRSIKSKIYKDRLNTKTLPGSPVYHQTKTTTNPTKEFMTNDGSRIMNFFGHAQGLARASGSSYSARYILFTTGNKLHWVLNENTLNMIEVVNYSEIKKRVNGNRVFWNHMREKFGLPTLNLPDPPMDPEYKSILAEIDEN